MMIDDKFNYIIYIIIQLESTKIDVSSYPIIGFIVFYLELTTIF